MCSHRHGSLAGVPWIPIARGRGPAQQHCPSVRSRSCDGGPRHRGGQPRGRRRVDLGSSSLEGDPAPERARDGAHRGWDPSVTSHHQRQPRDRAGIVTTISVPRPFGALILKAAAYATDSRDRDRHLFDAAALLACVEDPFAERDDFAGSDRRRVGDDGQGAARSSPRLAAASRSVPRERPSRPTDPVCAGLRLFRGSGTSGSRARDRRDAPGTDTPVALRLAVAEAHRHAVRSSPYLGTICAQTGGSSPGQLSVVGCGQPSPGGHRCRSEASWVVARGGVEPPTFRFSVGRSYQLSYLAGLRGRLVEGRPTSHRQRMATPTGLEPATSAVTGRRANQLRYGANVSWRRTGRAVHGSGPAGCKAGACPQRDSNPRCRLERAES
jgi:hypothetical protein